MSKPIKREIFLHYPTIDMAKAMVHYHNFGPNWNKSPAILMFNGVDTTEEGLLKEHYDIVYYKKRFLRRDRRFIFGRVTFLYEKANIGRKIVHQVNIQAYGLPIAFQKLKSDFEDYYGQDRVCLNFVWNHPIDW